MAISGRARCVAAAAAVLAGVACQDPTTTPVADDAIQSLDADQVMYGMTTYLTTSGIREGRVTADTAYMYADDGVADLRKMEIVFYDEEGRERATVTGERGSWSQESDVMSAYGNVVLLVHQDGSKLESAEIQYDQLRDRIWSDSTTVRTMADGTVTTGTAFESDMSFENIVVQNPRGGARRRP